jgi:hypothetical protein
MSASKATDLRSIFARLALPAGEDAHRYFSVAKLPILERYRVGKDSLGHACLLIAPLDTGGSSPPAPLQLERLDVRHGALCRVHYPDGTPADERLTLVRCTSTDLVPYFLRVCESIVASLGPDPGHAAVADTISKLITLFEAIGRPPRGSVQGLWAEVLLIARSRDPRVLARAWHAGPDDRFDFSHDRERVEVKSTTGYDRRHHFALEQLRPEGDVSVVVASMFVERAGGGTSIRDLIDELQAALGPGDLSLRLEQVVAETLGSAFRAGVEESFDLEHARQTLMFYDAQHVPTVAIPLPRDVSGVRFVSDLSEVRPYHFDGCGPLLNALQAAV